MEFVAVRDFRTQSKLIWDKVSKNEEIIITNNGKPTALLINISEGNFDETLASVRQAKIMRTVNRMREQSAEQGYLTESEIEAEIQTTRADYTKEHGAAL
jgi:prevent-host-death family protein